MADQSRKKHTDALKQITKVLKKAAPAGIKMLKHTPPRLGAPVYPVESTRRLVPTKKYEAYRDWQDKNLIN
jgi:hypothetical protein